MKIKMLVPLAGTSLQLAKGDEHDCDVAEAVRHVRAGHALPVDKAEYEKAVAPGPAETR